MPNAGDRGVSEVVGFILVFSIILGTISIVYVTGFSGLADTRDAERVDNAERAFDVLANNFQQMARGRAPHRATEIKLADAGLSTTDVPSLSTNSTSLSAAAISSPVAIVYTTNGPTEIVYEAGAVIRTDREGGVMVREPDFIFDRDHTVIRYIEPRGTAQSVGGTTTVLVRGSVVYSEVLASESNVPAGETVTFNVTTTPQRAVVWERYLESEIDWVADPCQRVAVGNTETVHCEFELDSGASLFVAETRIQVTISA